MAIPSAAAINGEHPPKENNGSSSSSKQLQKDAILRAPHSTLLPMQQLHSIVSAWLQDDVPSHFDVGGYVVGPWVWCKPGWDTLLHQ